MSDAAAAEEEDEKEGHSEDIQREASHLVFLITLCYVPLFIILTINLLNSIILLIFVISSSV